MGAAVIRRIPLRRKPHKDPVSWQARQETIERDLRIAGGCVAPFLDPEAGDCRDFWGDIIRSDARLALTVDHVRPHPSMAMRAPSVPRWMVALCPGHHLHSGWATANRPLLRGYLELHGEAGVGSSAAHLDE